MKSLVLIGGGGHCRSVLDAALGMKCFKNIVITDQNISAGTRIMGCEVVGRDEVLEDLFSAGYELAFISLGSIKSSALRKELWQKARQIGFAFPCIVDPTAVVSEYAYLDEGVFVGKTAVVNAGAYIERNAIINTGAIIEHDCKIGEFSHVAPGACICGGCDVGTDSFIGAHATLIQGIHMADNGFVKAGEKVWRTYISLRKPE